MAREKMVTRTVATTVITALVLNTDTLEAKQVSFTVPGEYEVGTKETKALLAKRSDDTYSYVKATNCEKVEKLYGMSESVFLQYAKELPPRTKAEAEEA